ncbi:MAG: hypothetical protein M3405_04100 [Acidobacteriota bacterium]|nr:hypothetical protein [Acidobacteriota bacterium]
MIKKTSIFVLAFLIICLCQGIFAQTNKEVEQDEKPQAKLVDILKKDANSEFRSLLIDRLLSEIQQNKNSKGAIIIYCGKVCQLGEIEAHIRGINHKLRLRGVNPNDLIIISGGFKENQLTELWLIPENACLPSLKTEIEIEKVKFKGTFKNKIVYYECCAPDLK